MPGYRGIFELLNVLVESAGVLICCIGIRVLWEIERRRRSK